MFSIFSKKETAPPDFSGIGCDMHSHLIPGIDDGSQNMDMSIRMIRGLTELGYKKIITTPHIISDMYPNTPDIILGGLANVKAELEKENIKVELSAAAEYMMNGDFAKSVSEGAPLLTLQDNWVLVELSLVVPSINLKDILFRMQIKGYQPVIAHPERYLYLGANKAWYDELKNNGCLFQLNLLSLKSHYGKGALELANYLIKKRYIDLLGTDMHHEGHLALLQSSSTIHQAVHRLLDTGLIRNASLLR